jgi:predicted nucleotidyltransferase
MDQVLTETLRHFFAEQPVSRAYLFGSVARGNATEQSDLDVLVELDKGATLFDHARMSWQLEDLLQHRVDVVTEGGLSPHIRPFIERDCILVYERQHWR